MLTITFLGTGTSQGVPMIGCDCDVCLSKDYHDKRLRSSVLIEGNDTSVVIDSGPDFRYQMLRENVRNLDGVLITHEHKDHTGGMDDIRAYNYILKRSMDVYAEKRVVEVIRKDFDYAFVDNPYPGVPRMDLHEINEEPFTVKNLTILPIRGRHLFLEVLGFRVGDFCYITDMNSIDHQSLDKMKELDTLVINALRIDKHISHFSLSEALEIIEKLKPRRAYLTHISHQLGLYKDMANILPSSVEMAYDGLKITVQ